MRPSSSTSLVVALLVAALATPGSGAPVAAEREPRVAPTGLKPDIRWKRIDYGAKRRRQMAGYSLRHYGHRRWQLDPRMVVQHYTAGTSWRSAWHTFANNGKYNGEFPGTCAHFIIDTDGTIFQLVDVEIRCRHVIGLNHRAVGVEHVGTSDRQILRNGRMMRASYRLSLWLMAKYDIELRNVIGHNESLAHPFHKERRLSWRCLTHGDWSRPHMRTYRGELGRRAQAAGVPIGREPGWVSPNC